VVLPMGTMLSARPGAAIGRWSIALPTVIDTILKALAPAIPHMIPAAHKGDMGGCSFFGFRDDGSRFLVMNIFGGGWGGRPQEDGESASVSVCQGDVRNTPVELQEIKYPVLISQHALRQDSGGAGQHRGGFGLEVTYKMLQKCKANINCERTVAPPWGLHGGHPGAHNRAIIRRADGTEVAVRKATEIEIGAGDAVTFYTAGGGGYGDPALRSSQEVARDVAEGVISLEAARRDYGYAPATPRRA
jgi:N-methylhydantoinase B